MNFDNLVCHSCEEYAALRAAWLDGDIPGLKIWRHVHSCEICQERVRLAQADVDAFKAINERPIPVQLPVMIGVEV